MADEPRYVDPPSTDIMACGLCSSCFICEFCTACGDKQPTVKSYTTYRATLAYAMVLAFPTPF